jgi:predicted ATPase
MYLKSIEFKEKYRCFDKGDRFNFKSITLLVGNQGCGKSSILDLLARNDTKTLNVSLSEETKKKGVDTFYFDTEKMNPRITNPISYSNIDGTSKGIGVGHALNARFVSHGETLVVFTVDALKTAKDCIVFLDEPESALSLRNQFRLTEEVFAASNRNCQLIIATHCFVLIDAMEQVLSLEHRSWLTAKRFIETQKIGEIDAK